MYVNGTRHLNPGLAQVLDHWWIHFGCNENFECVHLVLTWSESVLCIISLIVNESTCSSEVLNGFISPKCLCLDKTISSGHVLTILHNHHNGNFSPKF